jgi:hypothetical protein
VDAEDAEGEPQRIVQAGDPQVVDGAERQIEPLRQQRFLGQAAEEHCAPQGPESRRPASLEAGVEQIVRHLVDADQRIAEWMRVQQDGDGEQRQADDRRRGWRAQPGS